MITPSQAREQIGRAIRDNHEGVNAFSKAHGLHFTNVYSFLAGGGMTARNAEKMRGALPEIDDEVWQALRQTDGFAPSPKPAEQRA